MGADAKTTTNLSCSTDTIVMDENHYNELKELSHEEELKKLKEIGSKTPILPSQIGTDFNYKREIVWLNCFGFALLHLIGLAGTYLFLDGTANIKTTIYSFWLMYATAQGVTMGAHRLFCHRSFKAKTSLKIILLWLHTLAGQNCLWVWVRDHRQHHKYSDTDADPHNANRGFFFSHIGWLLSRKHPKVIEYGKKIDMSDLEADPWVMFQKNYYKLNYFMFAFLLPTSIPVIFWNEDPLVSLLTSFFARTVISLNGTWLVNSAAHLYGTRPFDSTIFPVESWVISFIAVGEGWHNYHHAFPWDYRASELGSPLNLTGFFIDILANIGLIYDRKDATHNMVKNRVMRTGDKSHKVYGTSEGRRAVTTLFNLWKHPLNPTYNSIYSPKPKFIGKDGYALIPDELKKSELDDELLAKENFELCEKQKLQDVGSKNEDPSDIMKYIVHKYFGEKSDSKKSNGKLTKSLNVYGYQDEFSSSESVNCENTNNNNSRSRKRVVKEDLNVTECSLSANKIYPTGLF